MTAFPSNPGPDAKSPISLGLEDLAVLYPRGFSMSVSPQARLLSFCSILPAPHVGMTVRLQGPGARCLWKDIVLRSQQSALVSQLRSPAWGLSLALLRLQKLLVHHLKELDLSFISRPNSQHKPSSRLETFADVQEMSTKEAAVGLPASLSLQTGWPSRLTASSPTSAQQGPPFCACPPVSRSSSHLVVSLP